MATRVRQTSCRYCGQDIENFAPYRAGEWRDRGNNPTCPTPAGDAGLNHAPFRVGLDNHRTPKYPATVLLAIRANEEVAQHGSVRAAITAVISHIASPDTIATERRFMRNVLDILNNRLMADDAAVPLTRNQS